MKQLIWKMLDRIVAWLDSLDNSTASAEIAEFERKSVNATHTSQRMYGGRW